MTLTNRWKLLGLPIVLLVLHTLLIEAYSLIELEDAWNDMNPTMLVAVAVSIVDRPLIALLGRFVDFQEHPGVFLMALKLLGGLLWFSVGLFLTAVFMRLMATAPSPQKARTAVH